MNRKPLISLILPFALLAFSCGKQNENNSPSKIVPSAFSIIGKWGMISGSIVDSDGSTDRYPSLGEGKYYQMLDFKYDGTYIKRNSEGEFYGTYSYNDSNHNLLYKLDSQKYFNPAIVTIHSSVEMTIFTDWGSVGSMTQYFEKLL